MAWYAKYDGVDGQFGPDTDGFIFQSGEKASGHPGGANFAMGDGSVRFLGDGSVRSADTSAIATLVDFDFPGEAHDDGLLLPAVQDDGLLLPAVQTD